MNKLSEHTRGVIRQFSYWLAAGTLGGEILSKVSREDYLYIFEEPSACEIAFAIFLNNLELSDEGKVLNLKVAEMRAAQYLRNYLDSSYQVIPALEDWEIELYPFR